MVMVYKGVNVNPEEAHCDSSLGPVLWELPGCFLSRRWGRCGSCQAPAAHAL